MCVCACVCVYAPTKVGGVNGQLDDGVTDMGVAIPWGHALLGGAGEGDVQEGGHTGRGEDRVPAPGWRGPTLQRQGGVTGDSSTLRTLI